MDYLVVEVGSGANTVFHCFADELAAQDRHDRSTIDRLWSFVHFFHPDAGLVNGVKVAHELAEVHTVRIGVVHSDLMAIELKYCVFHHYGQLMNIFCEISADL